MSPQAYRASRLLLDGSALRVAPAPRVLDDAPLSCTILEGRRPLLGPPDRHLPATGVVSRAAPRYHPPGGWIANGRTPPSVACARNRRKPSSSSHLMGTRRRVHGHAYPRRRSRTSALSWSASSDQGRTSC